MPTSYIDSQDAPDEGNLFDILQVVAENVRLLIFGSLFAGVLALGITFLIKPTFTATTVFLPPQQQQTAAGLLMQSLGALGGAAASVGALKNPNDQYVAFLKTEQIQNRLIQRFNLQERYEEKYLVKTRKALSENTHFSSSKDGLITVKVEDHDPKFSALLANAHVEELKGLMQRLAVTEAKQRRIFFEDQLLIAKEKLVKAEQGLSASGVNVSILKNSPGAAIAGIAQLQSQITLQEVKLSTLRNYLSESSPLYKQSLAELNAFRLQMKKLEQRNDTPLSSEADYIARFRDFKYFETLFELFARQFELAKVDEAREGVAVQVLDVALVPELKAKPKRGIIAITVTLLAGMLLLIFVFARDKFRKIAGTSEGALRIAAIRRAIKG